MSTQVGQMGQQQSYDSQMSTRSGQSEHSEGVIARTIEQQTAKLPSDIFLWGALASMGTSAVLQLMGKQKASLFIGDWVSPLLLFGVYNKIVKVQGSDRHH